jgi:hypothetical protein
LGYLNYEQKSWQMITQRDTQSINICPILANDYIKSDPKYKNLPNFATTSWFNSKFDSSDRICKIGLFYWLYFPPTGKFLLVIDKTIFGEFRRRIKVRKS